MNNIKFPVKNENIKWEIKSMLLKIQFKFQQVAYTHANYHFKS